MDAVRLAVVIGRFQPVHIGHMRDVLLPAYRESDHVLILLGSANRAPSPKNPFSPEKRADLIREAYAGEGLECTPDGAVPRVQFRPLFDYAHTLSMWLEDVQRLVGEYESALRIAYGRDVEVTLYGTKKDASSFYLDHFPQWSTAFGNKNNVTMYAATRVRNSLYEGDGAYTELVPPNVREALDAWQETDTFVWCRNEHAFYKKYREPYEAFERDRGHGIIGVTVDPVCFNRGRVLLVKRRFMPGKGLWALPGGYIKAGEETPFQAVLRELREETRFRANRSWLFAESVYGTPDRSLKGHTISIGYGFEVPDHIDSDPVSEAMAVKGGSDALSAAWVPLNDVRTKPEFIRGMFEDHFDIVMDMHRQLPALRSVQ